VDILLKSTSFFPQFPDFTEQHPHFLCQRFAEFIQVLRRIRWMYTSEEIERTPWTLKSTCSRAVERTASMVS
jgi:hypothetical protein